MKRLRQRARRIDTLRTENRPRRRGRVGRIVYLSLLAVLMLALFDVLAGDLIYLRGEGMVSRDVSIISPEFSGVVASVDVKPGDQVRAGTPLAVIRSQVTLRDIAQRASEVALTEAQLSEMRIRKRKLESLMPLAKERVGATAAYRDQIGGLREDGLVTVSESATAIEDAFDALATLEELEEEIDIVVTELSRLGKVAERARDALAAVETTYAGGVLSAKQDGIVGTINISPGEGIEEGQRVIEIFHGAPYVLAFIPAGALYDVAPGEKVVLRYGFRTVDARIESRLPLAYRLPQEFQRAFQTVERQQLIRIALDPGAPPPPLFTEVEVTRPWGLRASFAALADGTTRAAGIGIDAFAGVWRRLVRNVTGSDEAQ